MKPRAKLTIVTIFKASKIWKNLVLLSIWLAARANWSLIIVSVGTQNKPDLVT
jgi:hypothetical protein